VTRKSLDGAGLGSVELEPTFFGIEPNMAVLHQVIKAQLAAKRSGTQSTKTRREVAVVAGSLSIRRAPGERVREPSARPTTRVVVSPSDPSRASTTRRRPRK